MTDRWPSFVTKDLGDTPDHAEMMRRWKAYERDMKALIAKGGVHQDGDGWWIDDATGELIGPDPEIERPLTTREVESAKPFKEVLPELYKSVQRSRGRPPLENTKRPVTIRLNQETIDKFKATGKGWQSRISDILDKAAG